MKKCLSLLSSFSLVLGLMTSCNDDLSLIGESIQPKRDVVNSEKYFLQFEAQTVAAPQLYSGMSPDVLIGAYSDPIYGSFKADFAAQFRTGAGLQFEPQPEAGQIDSVALDMIYNAKTGFVGSRSASVQLSAYELPADFTGADTSTESLAKYAVAGRLLGEKLLRLDTDAAQNTTDLTQSGTDIYTLRLPLNKTLGQRIYSKSRSNPESFATQERFVREVFSGLYVTPTTGRGFVIKPLALSLKIFYHFKNAEGKNEVAYLEFINTKLTARRNGLTNADLGKLLQPDATYSYSKGPAGVQTAIRLPKAQMKRLLEKQGDVRIGKDWTLADTQLNLQVDNPESVLLNPPAYMMLMPADSLATYFKRGLTERSAEALSYLSTKYNSVRKSYNFYNIGTLLTKHLEAHAKYQNGAWDIAKDLELRVVPVERSISGQEGSGNEQTTAIDEYLFPNFVRLRTDSKVMNIGVTASVFK